MIADNGTEFHNRWSFVEVVAGETVKIIHHEPVNVFMLKMRFADDGHDCACRGACCSTGPKKTSRWQYFCMPSMNKISTDSSSSLNRTKAAIDMSVNLDCSKIIRIERTIAALPRELVLEAYSDPKHFDG